MPDGNKEIEKEEFIQYYSNAYYIKNNVHIEDIILSIFNDNIDKYNEEYIKRILGWKTGSILQNEYSDIKYKKGFEKEKNKISIYKKIINLSDVLELLKVAIEKENKEKDGDKKFSVFLSSFYSEGKISIKGIGPVYALTLRFFATKGCEPIFDSFAQQALWSITEKRNINNVSPTYDNIVEIYKEYTELIKSEFYNEYENRYNNPNAWRKVDQALWTYGHCYHVMKYVMDNTIKRRKT